MRGQHLVIAVLLTLLLALLFICAVGGFYRSRSLDVQELDFPKRAEKSASLI